MQETHTTKNKYRIFNNEWGGKIFYSDGETNSRGVAILLSQNLDVEVTEVVRDKEGRNIEVAIKLEHQSIRLVNIYAPNKDIPDFYSEQCKKLIERNEDML